MADTSKSESCHVARWIPICERRRLLVLRGRRALLSKLVKTYLATADDVRKAVWMPPNIATQCLATVPRPFVVAGIICRIGRVRSTRPKAHRRTVAQWALKDRAGAIRWLADHPAV